MLAMALSQFSHVSLTY